MITCETKVFLLPTQFCNSYKNQVKMSCSLIMHVCHCMYFCTQAGIQNKPSENILSNISDLNCFQFGSGPADPSGTDPS